MITASLIKELREKTGAGMLDCKKALEETNGNLEASIDWLREKGISKAAKKAERIATEGLASILVEGNKAIILEVNSETDFVSKNEEFRAMIATIASAIIESDAKSTEEALQLPTVDGTVADLIVAKTAKIGEKLSLRRFEVVTKENDEHFGAYIHMGGKIAVLTVVKGASEEVAREVSMHAAAMRPTYVRISEVSADTIEHEKTVLKEQAVNEGKTPEIAEKMVSGRISKFYKEVCLEEQDFVKNSDITVKAHVSNNGGTILSMNRFEVGEGMEKKEENFAEEVMLQINKSN